MKMNLSGPMVSLELVRTQKASVAEIWGAYMSNFLVRSSAVVLQDVVPHWRRLPEPASLPRAGSFKLENILQKLIASWPVLPGAPSSLRQECPLVSRRGT